MTDRSIYVYTLIGILIGLIVWKIGWKVHCIWFDIPIMMIIIIIIIIITMLICNLKWIRRVYRRDAALSGVHDIISWFSLLSIFLRLLKLYVGFFKSRSLGKRGFRITKKRRNKMEGIVLVARTTVFLDWKTCFNFNLSMDNKYIHYNVWEVWEWMNNFISHFTERVITYPCWGLSWTMLVQGASIIKLGRMRDFHVWILLLNIYISIMK